MSLKEWKGRITGRGDEAEPAEMATPEEALTYWLKVEKSLTTLQDYLAYMSPETEELPGLVEGTEEAIEELRTRALAFIGRYTTLVPAAPVAHGAPVSHPQHAPQYAPAPVATHAPHARQGAMPAWDQGAAHGAPAHGAPPAAAPGPYAAHEYAAHGEPVRRQA